MHSILIFPVLALAAASLIAAEPPAPTFANVPYGAHPRQVIDFYRAEGDGPAPVVYFIHGGGWGALDKANAARMLDIPRLLRAGISVAAVNYRYVHDAQKNGVEPPVKWPLEDAARGLQFLRSKSSEWRIDKARIGACGGSAGACSSLWLALHDDMGRPDSADSVARESTRLWCAAVVGAQTSLDPRTMREWMPNATYGGHAFGFRTDGKDKEAEFQRFYDARDKVLPFIREYSPIEHASADDPPLWLSYADEREVVKGTPQKDPTHSALFGAMLQQKLQPLGVDVILTYPGKPAGAYKSSTDYFVERLRGEMARPGRVEIRREHGHYRLYRNGQPYPIRGVVYVGDQGGRFPMNDLASRGANSILSSGGRETLDEAHRLGLSVLVNLPFKKEALHKFDYDDPKAVREQFEAVKQRILALKNHPAVLMWAIGNELSVGYKNRKVWDAVNQVARFIHEVDPGHPCMTVIGDGSVNSGDLVDIRRRAPDLDLIGLNYYKGVESVAGKIRTYEWDKPYVLTEWGPSGDWQMPRTPWDVALEEPSTMKAGHFVERYKATVETDTKRCLGSYAFIWGARLERTHTWYGMHLVKTATVHQAEVNAKDPDNDPLQIRWEVLPEVVRGGYAGMGEKRTAPVVEAILQSEGARLTFAAPRTSGAYRVFVYVTDGRGNGGTANFPFYVQP